MCEICHQTMTWFNKHEGLSQIIVTKWLNFKLYVSWNTLDKTKGVCIIRRCFCYCVALFICSAALTPYWQSSISVLKVKQKFELLLQEAGQSSLDLLGEQHHDFIISSWHNMNRVSNHSWGKKSALNLHWSIQTRKSNSSHFKIP